ISPLSNTADIFTSGFSAASFSFLALNRGLYSRSGRRFAKEGTTSSSSSFYESEVLLALICCNIASLWSLTSADTPPVLLWSVAFLLSLAYLDSSSTTMCFFSRDQPPNLAIRPLGIFADLVIVSMVGSVEDFILLLGILAGVSSGEEFWEALGSELCCGNGLASAAGLKEMSADTPGFLEACVFIACLSEGPGSVTNVVSCLVSVGGVDHGLERLCGGEEGRIFKAGLLGYSETGFGEALLSGFKEKCTFAVEMVELVRSGGGL
uniref:Uncharacterized protein n=1 Tax=Esox lucius TaxID=8010 RepID=A0AAY5JWL1_ESOLU